MLPRLYKSRLRRRCLLAIGSTYIVIAVLTLIAPARVAASFGYILTSVNSYSEFYAVYVGVWLATAFLSLLAAHRITDALLGDLSALFVLAQPAARLLAVVFFGMPQGSMLSVMLAEIVGGLLIVWIRPQA